MELYPFQKDGARWLWEKSRGLLADQMGLGKTPTALMAIPKGGTALVVCPAVMKWRWHEECLRWRVDLTPTVLEGKKSFTRWPNPGELLIANFDILPASPPSGFPLMTFIVDEAHYCKTSTALRTKKVRAIAGLSRRVYLLTGTPILNEPLDAWNILQVANLATTAFDDWPTFVRLFHGKQIELGSKRPGGRRWRKWVWGRVDPSVPERLKRTMLRRTRAEVLPELPVKTYNEVRVDLDDPEAKRLCDEAAAKLLEVGIDVNDARARSDLDSIHGEVLGALSAARAALSEAKLPWAIELCDDLQAQGEPIVFWSAHRAPVEAIGAAEGWATILGGTPNAKRQDIVNQFQDGNLKGIALTIGAGGVGITLTRAAHAVFVDLDWVPAANSQAEDRICRIGQTRGCIIHRIIADHPVDAWVTRALARKQAIIEASMGGIH